MLYLQVGRAQEYSDFTYGRVKRTFQENDPETMAHIKSGMESLGFDIDEAIARVKAGQGASDDHTGVWAPKRLVRSANIMAI